ncbi:MAG: efflux RND transporter periplasmic adaptor subunit [bacterium]
MKKRLLPVLVVALVVFLAWLLAHRETASGSVSGTIEADEVRAGSRYGGRVIAIRAAEGDALAEGQPIAELEAPELRARRDEVAALLAELEAGPRVQEIAAASNEWQAVLADFELARVEQRRAENMFSQKTISESDRDSAVRQAASLEKKAEAARERFDNLQAGTRPERIAQARAQIAEIDAHIAELNIAAPWPATLESLHVKVGDVVPPNGTVATLVLGGERWVRVYIPEPWVGHVKVGDEARVAVDAFPGTAFKGVVVQVNRKAEFTPRNVQTVEERVRQVFGVKVRLVDPDGKLQPGMAADVTFPSSKNL